METTPAILLRKSPWSETSFILTLLTERFGTLRVVARGARKPGSPFAGKMDIFFRLEISFALSRSGSLHNLREAEVVAIFDAAAAESAGFYLAAYFCELSGLAGAPMHPAAEIFDLLARGLSYVQREPACEKALIHFEKEICRILGVHDAAGAVNSLQALESLCGKIPASRAVALEFFEKIVWPQLVS